VKLDVERLRCNDPAAIKALHEACRQYAKIGASSMGAGDFADDISQDMFLHIMSGFLESYDPERDVDGWMMTYAQRAAQAMKRKHRWHREFQSEGLETLSAADDDVERQLEEEEEVRQAAKALEELNRRARRAGFGPPPPRDVNTAQGQEGDDTQQRAKSRLERWQHKMRTRPVVHELKTCARRLGLTQYQLATLFGITLNHLRAILYGRIAGTPEAFLKKLKALERKHARSNGAVMRPIQQTMERWRDRLRLGREPGWYLTLGEALGVHRATVYRWKNGLSQPPPHVVRFLDACIEAQAKRTESVSARKPSGAGARGSRAAKRRA